MQDETTQQEFEAEAPQLQAQPAPAHEGKKSKGAKNAAAEAAMAQKLEALEKELATTKDTLLRTAAEYDNFRKRSTKEKEASFGNGLGHAVERLLPVLDTLSLAAAAESTDESYKKGVLMTMDKCKDVFEKLDVREIEAQDKPFDPELHAAVLQQPAPEGVESGTVLQVLQKGYTYGEKVLRHATVAVAE